MTPDDQDHRHGTYAGAVKHWLAGDTPCHPCTIAGTRYAKRRRADLLAGKTRTATATGTIRRVHALTAIGHTHQAIADASGVPLSSVHNLSQGRSARITVGNAEQVAAAYERLSMTVPTGRYATRQRNMAAKRGFAPPLAWDDIDDPNATPVGHTNGARSNADVRAQRVAFLEHALEHGHTLARVIADLNVNGPESVRKSCQRIGRPDIYAALSAREETWRAGTWPKGTSAA